VRGEWGSGLCRSRKASVSLCRFVLALQEDARESSGQGVASSVACSRRQEELTGLGVLQDYKEGPQTRERGSTCRLHFGIEGGPAIR